MKFNPVKFGQQIRAINPGVLCSEGALRDWHRRIALSILHGIGIRTGSNASIKFIRESGL